MPSLPVIGGDAAAACIAAASVLAKVSRDRLMVAMEQDHPGYGFALHKGYCTPTHTAALAELGPCSEHRYSFVNVRRACDRTFQGERSDGKYEVVIRDVPEDPDGSPDGTVGATAGHDPEPAQRREFA